MPVPAGTDLRLQYVNLKLSQHANQLNFGDKIKSHLTYQRFAPKQGLDCWNTKSFDSNGITGGAGKKSNSLEGFNKVAGRGVYFLGHQKYYGGDATAPLHPTSCNSVHKMVLTSEEKEKTHKA